MAVTACAIGVDLAKTGWLVVQLRRCVGRGAPLFTPNLRWQQHRSSCASAWGRHAPRCWIYRGPGASATARQLSCIHYGAQSTSLQPHQRTVHCTKLGVQYCPVAHRETAPRPLQQLWLVMAFQAMLLVRAHRSWQATPHPLRAQMRNVQRWLTDIVQILIMESSNVYDGPPRHCMQGTEKVQW